MDNYLLKQNEFIIERLLRIKELIIRNIKVEDETCILFSSLEKKEKDILNNFSIIDISSQTKFNITHTLSTLESIRPDKQEKGLNNISLASNTKKFINPNQINQSTKFSRIFSAKGNNLNKNINLRHLLLESSRNTSAECKVKDHLFKFKNSIGVSNGSILINNYVGNESSNKTTIKNKVDTSAENKVM